MVWLAPLALALGLAPPCTPPPVRVAPLPADTVFDTVFVATNRRRVAAHFTRDLTDSLWYGVYVVRLIVAPSSSPRALAPMHVTRVDSAALDVEQWSARLATAAADTAARRAALLYVHGYSSGPPVALSQAVQVKARGGHQGPLVVFLWPTHDKYVIPTPVTVYRDDARAAARSGPAFARVLRTVDSLAANLVLVVHSMGSRVALNAVAGDSATHVRLRESPLRAVGIFSPDLGADRFRNELAPRLPNAARRIALYGSSRDYLLGASALINRERRAAGIARGGAPLAGIELVDETRGPRADPFLLTVAGPEHAVRWASAALADFFHIVVADADPTCRVTVGTADAEGDGRWRLRRGVLASDSLIATCARPR